MATIPRVLLEETWALIPDAQIQAGSLAICLPPSTSVPVLKIWYGGEWWLATENGVEITFVGDAAAILTLQAQVAALTAQVNGTLSPAVTALTEALDGLSVEVSQAGGTRTIALNYEDGANGEKTVHTYDYDV